MWSYLGKEYIFGGIYLIIIIIIITFVCLLHIAYSGHYIKMLKL